MLLLLIEPGNTAIAVYRSTEVGSFTQGGASSKVKKGGLWIFDTITGMSAEIVAFRSTARMYGGTFPVTAYTVSAPKNKVLNVIGLTFSSGTSILSAQMLIGEVSFNALGGTPAIVALPKTLKGPTSFLDGSSGNLALQQATRTIRLDIKNSREMNAAGLNLDQVAALWIQAYRDAGYALEFWQPWQG